MHVLAHKVQGKSPGLGERDPANWGGDGIRWDGLYVVKKMPIEGGRDVTEGGTWTKGRGRSTGERCKEEREGKSCERNKGNLYSKGDLQERRGSKQTLAIERHILRKEVTMRARMQWDPFRQSDFANRKRKKKKNSPCRGRRDGAFISIDYSKVACTNQRPDGDVFA